MKNIKNKKMVISTAGISLAAAGMTALTCVSDTDWDLPIGWAILFYGVAYAVMATVSWIAINYN